MANTLLFGTLTLILPLVYLQSLIDPVNIPRMALGQSILGITFFVASFRSKKTVISFTWFHMLAILFLFLSFLSFPIARDQSSFIFEYGKYFFLLGVILITDRAVRTNRLDIHIISAMVTYAFLFQSILGLFHLVYKIPLYVGVLKVGNHQFLGTMTHSNQFSIHILMMFPLVLFNLTAKNRLHRIASIVAIVIGISLLIAAKTRSVWVAFPTALLASTTLFISSPAIRIKTMRSISKKKLTVFLATISLVAVSGIMMYRDQKDISRHWQQLTKLQSSGRTRHWSHTIDLIKERPLIGVGTGNWRLHYAQLGAMHVQRPHNDYLWIASESGLLSLVIWLLIGGIVVHALWRLNRIQHTSKSLIAVLVFGIVSFAIVSFFSFPKERTMHLLYFGVYTGLTLGLGRKELVLKEHQIRFPKRYAGAIIACFLLWTGFFSFNRAVSEKKYKVAITNDDLSAQHSISLLNRVDQFYYRSDPMSIPVNFHKGMNYLETGNFQLARANFEDALKTYPLHIEAMVNLGTLYELAGNRELAVESYRNALKVNGRNPGARLNLAVLEYKAGHYDESRQLVRGLSEEKFRNNRQQQSQLRLIKSLLQKR